MSVGMADHLSEGLAIAPLLPVATAVTAGLLLDHLTALAPGASLAAAIIGLIGWVSMLNSAKAAGCFRFTPSVDVTSAPTATTSTYFGEAKVGRLSPERWPTSRIAAGSFWQRKAGYELALPKT